LLTLCQKRSDCPVGSRPRITPGFGNESASAEEELKKLKVILFPAAANLKNPESSVQDSADSIERNRGKKDV
jgi:hypothetical protein